MPHLLTLLTLLLLMCTSVHALAQATPSDEPSECLTRPRMKACRTIRVEAILIEGLVSTHRYVVERELLFEEGSYTSLAQLEESMKQLRNTAIFRDVTYRLITQPVNESESVDSPTSSIEHRVVVISLEERWTLLPAFKVARGGGLTQSVISLSDENFLGRFLTVGFQYDRLGFDETFFEEDGAANSFVAWFRDPRFLNTRTLLGVELWSVNRLRSLYDPQGVPETGFLLQRRQLVVRSSTQLGGWFNIGANLELMSDSFSFDFVPRDRQVALPQDDGTAFVLRFSARLGRIDRDDYRVEGIQLTQTMGHSDKLWGADFRFTQLQTSLNYYKKMPWKGNLALRVQLGLSNAEQIQHLFYVGGLNRVRGFVDSRFRGQNYWVTNLEYRNAVYVSPWAIVQPIVFVDAATTANKMVDTIGVQAASVGGGIRLILPKIYGFTARVDYAVPIVNDGRAALSFGAQQFF